MKIIGLMSGTSADGVDACVAEIGERGGRIRAESLAFICIPYAKKMRERILGAKTAEDVCRLNFALGEIFADAAIRAAKAARIPLRKIDAIGSHGQTLFHVASGPERSTLQVGEPCVIAERTGVLTVADFRTRDIAAGGCGAPLVPMVDYLLLAHPKRDRVALNIGGIANVTLLPAGCRERDVVAFDTGPGNMVVDGLISLISRGRARFDRNGAAAGRGHISISLIEELLVDKYYSLPAPKSTGREKFGLEFAEKLLAKAARRKLSNDDIIATATALTACTIAGSVIAHKMQSAEIIASGGGVHNRTLMNLLAALLPEARVMRSDEFGIPADGKEALAFAVLAYLTLTGRPGNLTGATGAARQSVLGKIVPGK